MSVTEESPTLDAREVLLAERTGLLRTLAECRVTSTRERSDVTDGIGETEHLVSAEQRELSDRVAALTTAALSDVDRALVRLEAGTYGVCVSCGEQIPPARLEAVPSTDHCVNCPS